MRNCTSAPPPLTQPDIHNAAGEFYNGDALGGREPSLMKRYERHAVPVTTAPTDAAAFGTQLQVALDKQAKPVLPRRAHALPPPVSASRALLPRLTPLHRRWVT
jgi:hypothetical protein